MMSADRKCPPMSGPRRVAAKRERALVALLHAPTLTTAAAEARVNERTLRRWLDEDEFRTAFRAMRRQVMDGALTQLTNAMQDAVTALRRNLSPNALPAIQVRAAVGLLGMALRAADQLDLAERVEALEQHAEMTRCS
jgi:hypothetical protein